jgi:hypothetical protein
MGLVDGFLPRPLQRLMVMSKAISNKKQQKAFTSVMAFK